MVLLYSLVGDQEQGGGKGNEEGTVIRVQAIGVLFSALLVILSIQNST